MQGTGLGCIYVEGEPANIAAALVAFRARLESQGGPLMIAHRHAAIPTIEAWGTPGNALPLMRAVKQQFDPLSTLNPGRFVGGI